jgi:glycosyltransferase involved in cell wall biosynthesis/SAM-dependent methyltransferase
VGTGYGVITRDLVHRIKSLGHDVDIYTKHFLGGNIVVEGVNNYDGTQMDVINHKLESEGYDYIITFGDAWVYPDRVNYYFTKNKWVSSMFLDVQFMHPRMVEAMNQCQYQLTLTKHGKSELERSGFKPLYAPLGVDMKKFRPDEELRNSFRKKYGWEDKFVYGFLGINYGTDRKNIINLIKAFQAINKKHPETILYLHTSLNGAPTSGLPIDWILQSCGFPVDNTGPVRFCNQDDYRTWVISQDELVGLYNAFDVFAFPTQGEGFGMPIVEAQACGCPIITTDTTSGGELFKSGWLIPIDDDDYEFSTHKSWFAKVRLNKIYEYMEKSYNDVKADTDNILRKNARNNILEYDIDTVFNKYWVPMLNFLEEAKKTPVKLPNWTKEIYSVCGGRIYPDAGDCGAYHSCDRQCDKLNLFRFPCEPLTEGRSLMMRSYPLFPDRDMKDMLIDSRCPMSKWVAERFTDEVNAAWDRVIEYPSLRRFYKDKCDEGFFDNFVTSKLKDRNLNFDSEYSRIFSLPWTTIFQVSEEVINFFSDCKQVLDIGSGEGKIVRALNDRGINTKGLEINRDRVDNNLILYGNVTDIPYGDKTIDGIICIDTLEHISDPIKALREIFRVARKRVLIQVTSLNSWAFREDPTHVVKWQDYRWWREIAEFGRIIKKDGQRFYVEVVD